MRCDKRFCGVVTMIVAVAVCLAMVPGAWAETLTETDKVYASDVTTNAYFGYDVSVSGGMAIVGGPQSSGGGAAYLFKDDGTGDWTQQARLSPVVTTGVQWLGVSAGISGDTAIVGAYKSDIGYTDAGSAHIFQDDGAGNWGEVAVLTASDAAAGYVFGVDVAIHGDIAMVGSHQVSSGQGAVYVFGRDQGGADTWGEIAKLTAPDAGTNHNFGQSLDVQGDTAVIGAYGGNRAYIFEDDGTGWAFTKKLVVSGTAKFGGGVAIDGDQVVVGAYETNAGGQSKAGTAYVFSRDNGSEDNWGLVDTLYAPTAMASGFFGEGVAIEGDLITAGGRAVGSYLFEDDGTGNWTNTDTLVAAVPVSGSLFGYKADMAGGVVAVGAPFTQIGGSSRAGAAYIYAIPEPSSAALLIFGGLTLTILARRRK